MPRSFLNNYIKSIDSDYIKSLDNDSQIKNKETSVRLHNNEL